MQNTLTGNRVLLKIKGQVVGDGVQSVSIQDDFGLQRVDGLGDPETQELVVGAVTHTITLQTFRASGVSLITQGFVPNSNEWLTAGTLEIEVIDKITGETQELYVGCKASSYSRDYNKHVISGCNATFFAMHKSV